MMLATVDLDQLSNTRPSILGCLILGGLSLRGIHNPNPMTIWRRRTAFLAKSMPRLILSFLEAKVVQNRRMST